MFGRWVVAGALLVAGAALAGCGGGSEGSGASAAASLPTTPPTAASSAIAPTAATAGTSSLPAEVTRADVQAFVEEAVAYARSHPKQEALAAFTEAGGPFHRGELYVFAYDFDGNVIGHGGDPSLVGKNLMDMTDPNGVKVIEELTALAEDGGGWLEYTWPNPAHGGAEEPKLGYVMAVDDGWFLGSGMYPPAP